MKSISMLNIKITGVWNQHTSNMLGPFIKITAIDNFITINKQIGTSINIRIESGSIYKWAQSLAIASTQPSLWSSY